MQNPKPPHRNFPAKIVVSSRQKLNFPPLVWREKVRVLAKIVRRVEDTVMQWYLYAIGRRREN